MASNKHILAIGLIAAAAPLSAASDERMRTTAAPSGSVETRYCMRVAPTTGTLVERTRCWTRGQWAEQGVDVDRDWASEGVRTID